MRFFFISLLLKKKHIGLCESLLEWKGNFYVYNTTFNFNLFTIEQFSYLRKLCISDTTLPRVRLMQNCILYWASFELVFKSVISYLMYCRNTAY